MDLASRDPGDRRSLAASAPFVYYTENELSGITPEQFTLPSLECSLQDLGRRLTAGRGFEVVRGFPSRDIPERQAAAVFAGIGAHLGSLRSQNAEGHLVGHVRNVGADASDPNTRIYQTNQRQGTWVSPLDATGHTYECGFCGHHAAPGKQYTASREPDFWAYRQNASILSCPNCNRSDLLRLRR